MAPLRERLLNQKRGGNADMPIEIESQDSQEEEEEPVGAAVAEEENDDEAAMEEEEEMAAAEEAAAAKAAPISEDAVWEVRLAGVFTRYSADEIAAIERAYANGDESVPVREGRNEVRLRPLPFVQRARSGQPPCKEREVRRRVEAATSASEPSTSTADSARRRLRVRWAPLEAWVDCVIVDRRSFDGGVEQHRLKLLESGEEEWVELSEVHQVEYV